MTDADLKKLREALAGVTQPLPWSVELEGVDVDPSFTAIDSHGMWVANFGNAPGDARFAVEAANAISELIDVVERLRKETVLDAATRDQALAHIRERDQLRAALGEALGMAVQNPRIGWTSERMDAADARLAELRKLVSP